MPVVKLSNGREFSATAVDSLVDAALSAGITLPHSCKTGRCSTCKCKVLQGETTALQTETGLTDAEKIAIRYGELFATNHLAIDDAFYDKLREHFTEPQIVELGLNVAMCVGVGRLSATWDMVEELPERFRADGEVTPWGADAVIMR